MKTRSINLIPTQTTLKRFHGVNRGPVGNAWTQDYSAYYRDLQVPSVRLHDCPLAALDVADIHCIFPDFRADADDPDSYDFTQTDCYLERIRATGAEIYFRLGESIEHQPVKKYVNPPSDPDKWARVCVQIARHYNEGWAHGHHWNIRTWEIWNEPDLPECWNGTPQEFSRLFCTTVKALKAYDPSLRVGGPSFLKPMMNPNYPYDAFFQKIIDEEVPVDFLSWHRYFRSWELLEEAAAYARDYLAARGLGHLDQHLTELGYLPLVDGVTPMNRRETHKRRAAACVQRGAPGAAAIFGALARMQDYPISMVHFYSGDTGFWGLFDDCGLPRKIYYGLKAYAELVKLEGRALVPETALPPQDEWTALGACAPRTGRATVSLAYLGTEPVHIEIRVAGLSAQAGKTPRLKVVDADSTWESPPRIPAAAGPGGWRFDAQGPGLYTLEWS